MEQLEPYYFELNTKYLPMLSFILYFKRHMNRNRNMRWGKIGKTNRVMLDVVTFLAHTAHFISFVAYPPNAFEVKIKDSTEGEEIFSFSRDYCCYGLCFA